MAVVYPEPGPFDALFSTGTEDNDILLSSPEGTIMSGFGGSDFFLGGDGNDSIHGGAHDIFSRDVVDTEGDTVHAGAGNDDVRGSQGRDFLFGEDGNDSLVGFGGDDVMFGGSGNDTLSGEQGDDFLDGGAGADTFRYSTSNDFGSDTLGWFESGLDKLDLRAHGITDTATMSEALVSSSTGTEPNGASFLELAFDFGELHIPGITALTDGDFLA